MPPSGALPKIKQAFIAAWYNAGGPENDLDNGNAPAACIKAPGINPAFYDSACQPILPTAIYPGYNTLKTLVLQNKCLGCHYQGGKAEPLLDNYADAKASLDAGDIIKAVFQGKFMPKKGTLTDGERDLIGAWFQAGGPVNDLTAAEVPNPTPIPPSHPIPSPLPLADPSFLDANGQATVPAGKAPGYNTVYTLVFAKSCVQCHRVDHDSGDPDPVQVDDYEDARNSKALIEKEVMTRKMPPASIHQPLLPGQIAVVKAWVDAGAPLDDVSTQAQTQ
ncbi:MAG: cytochrome c [Oligoflexia bacterium]|nr:cytochrome c [Oligoflexia bacterium]